MSRWRLAIVIGCFSFSPVASAQTWTDKVTTTPSLVQTDFGPYGSYLPLNGQESCAATATTMSIMWLINNGFTQLNPTSVPGDPSLNLARLFNGLQNAPGVQNPAQTALWYPYAMETYLGLKGISSEQVSIESTLAPTVEWMNSHNTGQSVVNYQTGWYSENDGAFDRNGQHWVTYLAGESSNDRPAGEATINNPAPASFFSVPNLPSSNPQTLHFRDVDQALVEKLSPSLPSTSRHYIQVDEPGFGEESGSLGILEVAYATTISPEALPSSPEYEVRPFVINDETRWINTYTGSLEAIARLEGTGGFIKGGSGDLILKVASTLSGTVYATQGNLISTAGAGTPFGTGNFALSDSGHVILRPQGNDSAGTHLTIASGSESQVTYSGGNVLAVDPGSHPSLTLTVGGYTDGVTSNVSRLANGVLVLQPSTGSAQLGNTVKILVKGSGGNLPVNTNGIVNPSIVVQDNDAAGSGSFVTYGENGFAAFAGSADFQNANATTVVGLTADQTMQQNESRSVHALNTGSFAVSASGSDTTLVIGSQAAGTQSGLIMNGGSISVHNLEFGAAEALVYTSKADGTISSVINGSGGLTKFGEGNLTLTAENLYTGETNIQQGTLTVKSSGGSAASIWTANVGSGSHLVIDGATASVETVRVGVDGVITLKGGSMGALTTVGGDGGLQTGGTLQGHGDVWGPADLRGTLSGDLPGTITFHRQTTIFGVMDWKLTELTEDPNMAGKAWSNYEFLADANIAPFLNLDFANVADPNSGNSFWNEDHQWLLASFFSTHDTDFDLGDVSFDAGYFGTHYDEINKELYLVYNAVPEPSVWMLLGIGIIVLVIARFQRNKST